MVYRHSHGLRLLLPKDVVLFEDELIALRCGLSVRQVLPCQGVQEIVIEECLVLLEVGDHGLADLQDDQAKVGIETLDLLLAIGDLPGQLCDARDLAVLRAEESLQRGLALVQLLKLSLVVEILLDMRGSLLLELVPNLNRLENCEDVELLILHP